jgi:mRNA-degrading endonuclease RelE of RelBE toxin-antitoxin system
LKRREIYHSARKTRADRERTRLACNVNPARLDSALAVANFETRKTAAPHKRACQRMNEPEEYRQCGIELRSARKLANNCAPCPKKCVGTLGSEWETMRDDLRGDVLKLRDKGNRYRLRIGTFRVLFVLAGDMIQVYAVKDRKEAYE